MVGKGVVRVTGHEQDASLRELAPDLIAKLLAAHLGHDHVGNHKIKGRMLPNHFKGFKGLVGFLNLVASLAQDEDGQFSHR